MNIRKTYKKIRGLKASEEGSAAVEFALVAVPFLALLLASLQILVVFFAQQILETVADQSSRQILTGNAQTSGLTQTQFQTSICNNIPALLQCSGIMADIQVADSFSDANISTPTLTYNSSGHATNQWAYNIGTQGQIVVMRLMYQWPTVNFILNLSTQSNGTRLLTSTRVFRNENY